MIGTTKKIKIRKFSKQRVLILFVLVFLSCLTIISLFQMEKPDYGIQKAFLQFTEYSKDLFFCPKLSQKYSYAEIFFSLLDAFTITFLFSGVNFIAFEIKFIKTCFNRSLS